MRLLALSAAIALLPIHTTAGAEPEVVPGDAAREQPATAGTDDVQPAPAPKPARAVPYGWKEVKKGNTIFWCTRAPATGSRVRVETQCMTPVEYVERTEEAKRATEEITRKVIPPRGG